MTGSQAAGPHAAGQQPLLQLLPTFHSSLLAAQGDHAGSDSGKAVKGKAPDKQTQDSPLEPSTLQPVMAPQAPNQGTPAQSLLAGVGSMLVHEAPIAVVEKPQGTERKGSKEPSNNAIENHRAAATEHDVSAAPAAVPDQSKIAAPNTAVDFFWPSADAQSTAPPTSTSTVTTFSAAGDPGIKPSGHDPAASGSFLRSQLQPRLQQATDGDQQTAIPDSVRTSQASQNVLKVAMDTTADTHQTADDVSGTLVTPVTTARGSSSSVPPASPGAPAAARQETPAQPSPAPTSSGGLLQQIPGEGISGAVNAPATLMPPLLLEALPPTTLKAAIPTVTAKANAGLATHGIDLSNTAVSNANFPKPTDHAASTPATATSDGQGLSQQSDPVQLGSPAHQPSAVSSPAGETQSAAVTNQILAANSAPPVPPPPSPGSTVGHAGSATDVVASGTAPTQQMPEINTAKLVQSVGQSEMRVGLRSSEFGDVSIRTSVTRDVVSAQISLDHDELARMLVNHLPELQAKLSGGQAMEVRIDMNGQSPGQQTGQQAGQGSASSTGNGSSGNSPQSQQSRGSGSPAAGAELRSSAATAGSISYSAGTRLDITV